MERPKKEAFHSILESGRFNMQGNLHRRLVLSSYKTSRLLHLHTRILKVYIEDLAGFNNVLSPDGVKMSSCFKATSLKLAAMGRVGGAHIPKTR